MTPKFAKAVDPVFIRVLGLLERIARGENPSPQNERARIRDDLLHAEAVAGKGEEWQLAKYALVCWIDEVLIDAPWEGRTWWPNNILEFEAFHSSVAFERFYHQAGKASTLDGKDALEVFYLCVVLGFRGFYRDPEAAALKAQAAGLPPNLEAWVRQMSMAIRRGERPPIESTNQLARRAPPLEGQPLLITSSILTAVLGAMSATAAFVLYALPWLRG